MHKRPDALVRIKQFDEDESCNCEGSRNYFSDGVAMFLFCVLSRRELLSLWVSWCEKETFWLSTDERSPKTSPRFQAAEKTPSQLLFRRIVFCSRASRKRDFDESLSLRRRYPFFRSRRTTENYINSVFMLLILNGDSCRGFFSLWRFVSCNSNQREARKGTSTKGYAHTTNKSLLHLGRRYLFTLNFAGNKYQARRTMERCHTVVDSSVVVTPLPY